MNWKVSSTKNEMHASYGPKTTKYRMPSNDDFEPTGTLKNSKNSRFTRNMPKFGILAVLLVNIKHEFFQF